MASTVGVDVVWGDVGVTDFEVPAREDYRELTVFVRCQLRRCC